MISFNFLFLSKVSLLNTQQRIHLSATKINLKAFTKRITRSINLNQAKLGLKHFLKRTKDTMRNLNEENQLIRICLRTRRMNGTEGSKVREFEHRLVLLENLVHFTLLHHKGFAHAHIRRLMVEDIDHGYEITKSFLMKQNKKSGVKGLKLLRVSCEKTYGGRRTGRTLFSTFHRVYKELIAHGSQLVL